MGEARGLTEGFISYSGTTSPADIDHRKIADLPNSFSEINHSGGARSAVIGFAAMDIKNAACRDVWF
jgi:hypothetical protein